MEMIDTELFGKGSNAMMKMDSLYRPLRSFLVYGVDKYIGYIDTPFIIRVYRDKVTVYESITSRVDVADLRDGKEKFIEDLEFSLIKIKSMYNKYMDRFGDGRFSIRVSDVDDIFLSRSLNIDKFIPSFINLIDQTIKDVEVTENGCKI